MKQVYVFGAGASKASGNTPLGKRLVWDYHADCHLMAPVDNLDSFLNEEDEEYANFIEFLRLTSSIFPELNNLLEGWKKRGYSIFHVYNIEKRHYADELLQILHQRDDQPGIELVRKLICEHIVGSSFDSPNLLYKNFISQILKDRSPQQISIISFNFDCLLSENFESDVYFDYLLDFDWIDSHRKRFYAQTNPIKLLKLNGSLDWGICPSCNRLHLYFPPTSKHFYDDKKCSFNCGGFVQPLIVIPHEQYGSITEPLWALAKEELEGADIVTIIGYSFPPYDEKVKKLFAESLRLNTKLQIVDCLDPKESPNSKRVSIIEKYKCFPPLLKGEDIYLDRFEGYMNVCD
jgi:hypothetical protein